MEQMGASQSQGERPEGTQTLSVIAVVPLPATKMRGETVVVRVGHTATRRH